MIDFCDLLALLKVFKHSLKDVEVYGLVTKQLSRPSSLMSSVDIDSNSVCVEVDILAVNLAKYAQYLNQCGLNNPSGLYFVNGSMACYVNKDIPLPDWYTFRGNLNIGSKQFSPFVTMFNFKKSPSGWGISATPTSDIRVDKWDKDSRLFKALSISANAGKVVYPPEINTLPRFVSQLDIVPIKPQQSLPDITSLNNQFKEATSKAPEEIKPVNRPTRKTISSRDSIIDKNENYENLNLILGDAMAKKNEFIQELRKKYTYGDEGISNRIHFLFTQLKRYWSNKPNALALTGRAIIKDYIDDSGLAIDTKYLGTTIGKYLLEIFDELVDYVLEGSPITADGKALTIARSLFGDAEIAYAGILGKITGLGSSKLQSAAKMCVSNGISFSKLVESNPYELVLLSSIRFADIEHLAHCLGRSNDKDLTRGKHICILQDYTMHSDSGNTVYCKRTLRNKLGLSLSKQRYMSVKDSGTYLTKSTQGSLKSYIDESLTSQSWQYPTKGWVSSGFNYTLPLGDVEFEQAIKDFLDSGLGVEFNLSKEVWVTSSRYLEKELFIYDKLYRLSTHQVSYDMERVEMLIDQFEGKKGFKLEPEQRQAIRLIGQGVMILTGPAGGGKTTTAEGMVYVAEHYDITDVPKIQFATPTGKAAKRLQEVVGDNVRTLHSMFQVSGRDSESLLDGEDDDTSDMADIYLFDEMAMVTTDLLYSVLKKIVKARLFFLGDINQLPPIGKGLPFKNMLSFLPCVSLRVSKRCAESSKIYLNSDLINNYSESHNWRPLESGLDFRLMHSSDDNIASIVYLICEYYLGKSNPNNVSTLCKYVGVSDESELMTIDNLTPDDILVVSPIQKATYSWGTYRLNLQLQELFNPKSKNPAMTVWHRTSDKVKGTEFRIGDRVIHTSNMYGMQWYSTYVGGCLTRRWGSGIMNGDVGKIVDVLHSKDCEFYECEDEKPASYDAEREVRNDENFVGDDKYFVVVEYYDFDTDSNYYILYQAPLNEKLSTEHQRVFTGLDLSLIQLAYALTTHKMQGSQGKLIIFALGFVNFKGFITRNMVYTAVTRASDCVYAIGNVSNESNSMLSQARRIPAQEGVDTVTEVMLEV